jgi:hypothetical protein
MLQVRPRLQLELLALEMGHGPVAARAEVHLAGILFRVGDQFIDGLGRHARMHDEDRREGRDETDRLEHLQGIDARPGRERRRNRHRGIAEQDRVAIRLGRGDILHADGPGRTRLVFDEEAVAIRQLAHLLGDDPRHEVGRSASRVRNHHPDVARRVGLGVCGSGQPGDAEGCDGCPERGVQERATGKACHGFLPRLVDGHLFSDDDCEVWASGSLRSGAPW